MARSALLMIWVNESYRPKPFLPEQMAGVAGGQPLAPLANGSAQKKPRHTLALPVLMEEEDSDDEDDSVGEMGTWGRLAQTWGASKAACGGRWGGRQQRRAASRAASWRGCWRLPSIR